MGVVAPNGNNLVDFWDNIMNGRSAARAITRFNAGHFKTRFASQVTDFDPTFHLERNDIKRADLYAQYALVAAGQAIADSGFDLSKLSPFDVGVIIGSSHGGSEFFEQQMKEFAMSDSHPHFNPYVVPKTLLNMAAGLISIKYGFMGINFTTITACASSNTAIMDALNYIRFGKAKIIITGGTDAAVTEGLVGGYSAVKALSTRNDAPMEASRPFDVARDGFVMGEGAGMLVLEEYEHARARGAKIYAEVAGAAMTSDAYHVTATHPEGLGAVQAMKLALHDAGLNAEDINFLNAHATSTPVGDQSEAKGIYAIYGDSKNLLVSAPKSITGHLLGAAGAIEAIISVKAITDGVVPPTINTTSIDPAIPAGLQIVTGEAREHEVNAVMSNTFGFGGHNAVVVFKKA